MNSAIAVAIGLTLAIILILKKCHPVYALILGAVVSGLMSGWGFDLTIKEMFSGVRDISPAIVRILAAGVLTGVLVKTGAADKIALTIVEKAGRRNVFLALALSVFILTGVQGKSASGIDRWRKMRKYRLPKPEHHHCCGKL